MSASPHTLITSAIVLGSLAYIARNYDLVGSLDPFMKSGNKYEIIMEPLNPAMLEPNHKAKQVEPTLIAKGAAGNSEDAKNTSNSKARKDVKSYNWWVVTNELVNQIAPEYQGYNPLAYSLQPQPIYFGPRRNFYDPVNRRV